MFDIALFLKKTKGLFISEAGRDVCRDGMFFISTLGAAYIGGGTGRLQGRDVFRRGLKNCLYGKRDGTFAGTGRFLSRL